MEESRQKIIVNTYINDDQLRITTSKNINQFRKNGKFTDVTLKTRDETEIKVHRNIVARASSYFDNLFDDEKYSSNQIIDILYDISGYHMNLIIDYIYTGSLRIKFEDALELNKYAYIFFIKSLEEPTSKFLCDNINCTTCLEYWRHAGKISNYDLEETCIKYILENSEIFFENSIKELNFKEIKLILSKLKTLSSEENIFKNVILWLKSDFINCQSYISELLIDINVDEISSEFIRKNILFDKDLMSLNEIQIIVSKYFESTIKLDNINVIEPICSSSETDKLNVLNSERKSTIKYELKTKPKQPYNYDKLSNTQQNVINLITFSTAWMSHLNLESNSIQKLSKHRQRIKYSVNTFQKNSIFLCGGGWFSGSKKCQIYCSKTKTLQLLPPMKSNRKFHQTIEMNDKVYACGGLFNRGGMEFFDIGSEVWKVCTSNLLEKEKEFGIIVYENSLNTFGGNTSLMNSKSVERYDPREDKWFIINKNSIDLAVTRSVLINHDVYCFGTNFAQIYDIRKNHWRDKINYPIGNELWYNFDITEIGNKVIIGKSTLLAQKYDLLEYDLQENNWNYRKIEMKLFKGYMDFHIIKIYE